MNDRDKTLYIGAVALALRLHRAMGAARRQEFDDDGDPVYRLAQDFNAQGFGLEIVRSGSGGYAMVEREPTPTAPIPLVPERGA